MMVCVSPTAVYFLLKCLTFERSMKGSSLTMVDFAVHFDLHLVWLFRIHIEFTMSLDLLVLLVSIFLVFVYFFTVPYTTSKFTENFCGASFWQLVAAEVTTSVFFQLVVSSVEIGILAPTSTGIPHEVSEKENLSSDQHFCTRYGTLPSFWRRLLDHYVVFSRSCLLCRKKEIEGQYAGKFLIHC